MVNVTKSMKRMLTVTLMEKTANGLHALIKIGLMMESVIHQSINYLSKYLQMFYTQLIFISLLTYRCNFDGQDCTTSNASTPSPDLEDSTTPKSFDCSSCSRVKVYYESLIDEYNYKPSIFGHYKLTNQIINGHSYYESEHENQKYGIWMCSNKWHLEDAVHKGNCNAWAYNLDQKSCILDVDPTKWLLYEGFSSWKNANSNLRVKCSEWSLNL